MYENNLKHKLAEEHKKMAEEELKKANELLDSTLENHYVQLEQEDHPKYRTPEMKAAIARNKEQYIKSIQSYNEGTDQQVFDSKTGKMITNTSTAAGTLGNIVKEQTAEQLMKQNKIDKELFSKNAKIAQNDIARREEERRENERRAKKVEEKIEKQFKEEEEKMKSRMPSEKENSLYSAVMNEQEEARSMEEGSAFQEMEDQVKETRDIAYNNVINLGGSESEAKEAATQAASEKSESFKEELKKTTNTCQCCQQKWTQIQQRQ